MIKYRPDIDGLRAMAIIAVVLYHAFPKVIRGGFVGVDIFFVISGYLITAIIFKDLDANNFSIYNFYARRVKRILPALIVVITSCFILGWLVLTSDEYIHLARHARSSAMFVTNFVLASEENSYFDAASHAKPLMHLWSLAIEEQFYIVWPLLLYFTRSKKINFISVSIAIILLSFFFGLKVLKSNSVHAFYFAWLRSWELASGALCAYLAYHKIEIVERFKELVNHWCNLITYSNPSAYKETTARNIASILGFLINSFSILFFKDNIAFPGWYATLPVIGTMLMLSAGETAWVNSKILARKLCVWVGLISYPLYLWHWPLLSFAFIIEGHLIDKKLKLIILFISFVLSFITYRFIEKPIRSAKDKKYIVAILLGMLLLIGVFGHLVIKNDGYEWRYAHSINYLSNVPWQDQKFVGDLKINCFPSLGQAINKEYDSTHCIANSTKPKFFILGDSHSLSLLYGATNYKHMDVVGLTALRKLPFISYINSTSLTSQEGNEWMKEQYQLNHKYVNEIIEFYDSIEYVILATMGPYYFPSIKDSKEEFNLILGINDKQAIISSEEAFVEGYVEIINFLMSKGKKVIFVIDQPELDFDGLSCLTRPINLTKNKDLMCNIPRSLIDQKQQKYRILINKIKQRVPSLMVYDPITMFCDQSIFYVRKDNSSLYSDTNHLSCEGSKLLIDHFKQWFKEQTKQNF